MSRGYGKSYRKGNVHTNFQFDNLFKENSNRPSASRSAGTVGKWGITSFTSIRTANGLSTKAEEPPKPIKQEKKEPVKPAPAETSYAAEPTTESTANNVAKPKKFFKSRNAGGGSSSTDCGVRSDAAVYGEKADFTYGAPSKKSKSNVNAEPKTSAKPKKFFSSKTSKTTVDSDSQTQQQAKRDETKPPIVLRICRGKSQLLSDSDESESTPTPSSTPVASTLTSPRSTRENQRSPGHTRVTRSTRRSLQQDPSSSPATAESPTDTFSALFMSPKKSSDLSPVYIPAEKYELERKAMYDNLLRPNSPTDSASTSITNSDPADRTTIKMETDYDDNLNGQETGETNLNESSESASAQESIPEPMDTSSMTDEADRQQLKAAEELLEETVVEFNSAPPKTTTTTEAKKIDLQQDWTSDSESDASTSPDIEVPAQEPQQKLKNFPIEAHKEEILEKILEKPPENPSVKLVISKKKGSIFKSRSMVSDGSKKRRALYKHKWCDDKDGQASQKGANDASENKKNESQASCYDEFFDFEGDPLTRITHDGEEDEADAVTSVKCTKRDKDYYTVVRNVKKAHQIQEIGEFQEFNDDVEYILDALQDNNPNSTRCLSAITLASKCMAPAFRMHVRAHGTVAKFFKALHDATKDQSLGLCTATVMFVLSQDRLNMDLDRDCLELMLNLLESDVTYQQALKVCGLSSTQFYKNKQKVRELCAEIQSQGHAMHLNLDNITVGQLAMETLLSLTSKRAGEWFKEELRELGGLEHIMKTICECCRQLSDYVTTWTDTLLDKLRKIDRCMRVLENVTYNNEENQTYLLKYNDGVILDTLVKLYRLCDAELPLYPVADIADKESTGTVIREALLVTLKVLINLTHHFNKRSTGSNLVGARPGIIDASLHLLLQVPHYIPDQKKFELGVLVLMLLINLIQENVPNKKLLIEAKAPADFESRFPCDKTAVEALIVQFYQWEECARLAEKRTNAILDGEKDSEEVAVQPKTNEEFIEETVAKLLQKAGTHMEFTFLASYIVLLVGFLIMDNNEYQKSVRQFLKGQNFTDMVELLRKFFNFMNLTASTEASSLYAIKATEKVIKFLEGCDAPEQSTCVPYTSGSMDLDYS